MPTPADLLARAMRRDSARPLLTWYDDATGERVELSVATAANWATKAANWLLDELGMEPGSPLTLEPATHWLATVAALAAWTAGLCVDLDCVDLNGAELALPGDPGAFTASVLAQPDAALFAPPDPAQPGLRSGARRWSLGELGAAAEQAAADHRLGRGARVLTTIDIGSVVGMDVSLLMPLAADGSIVFVTNADESRLEARGQSERVTHIARSVDGLPIIRELSQNSD